MKRTRDEIVAVRLKKSEQVMMEAKTLIDAAAWYGAVNRLYYAAFHAVSALLYQHDIKHKAHAGAKAMLEFHFVKTGMVAVEWGRSTQSSLPIATTAITRILPFLRRRMSYQCCRKLKNLSPLSSGLLPTTDVTNSLHPRE